MARSGVGLWMAAAFGTELALAVAVLAVFGTSEPGLVAALKLTGRFSFILFWLAYTSGALAILFGPRFAPLAQRGRDFGLVFAAAHVVHLGLVVWIFRIAETHPVSNTAVVLLSIGVAWLYALALCSVNRVRNGFNAKFLRVFQSRGLDYIALLFVADLVLNPIRHGFGGPFEYAPFSLLAIAGPLLRFAAAVRTYRSRTRPETTARSAG